MGRRPEKTFCQRRYIGGQEAYEKMLNITNHQKNVYQNHNYLTCIRMAINQKTRKNVLTRMWRKGNPRGLLVEM